MEIEQHQNRSSLSRIFLSQGFGWLRCIGEDSGLKDMGSAYAGVEWIRLNDVDSMLKLLFR
jgi:hypothetical protein